MNWTGVIPAITTPFREDLTVDYDFLAEHCNWMVDAGCTGIVALGSLGEAATLDYDEKVEILRCCHSAVGDRAPIVAGVSALSTQEAVSLAKDADLAGCQGLMVLPPYVYKGDWRETKYHFESVINATGLSCMLYNNPVAYGTDIMPAQMAELCVHENLHSVKESSTDVRRVSWIRSEIGNRLTIFVGVDDVLLEGVQAGATGWIAGLVNAFPAESVKLLNLALEGKYDEAFELYSWFLPLLRLDTVPKFVQLIKLTQQEVGMGSERVRPPRLEIVGEEREETLRIIREGIIKRPAMG